MDFGIARVAGAEQLTAAGYMMGTPAYMAPEQVRGGDVDARADLYAVGVVFYRLTTAALPFKGDTAFAMAQSQVLDPPTPVGLVRPDLPPWVGEIVGRALAKAPEHRFQSAAEFHEAFARCLAGLPLSSMYGSGDPLVTPGRPISTGAFQMRPMPTPSGRFHQPAAVPAGEEVTVPLRQTPDVVSGSNDPTMMATPVRTASLPAAADVTGANAASSTTPPVSEPPRAGKRPAIALVAAAIIIVLAAGVGALMLLQGSQPAELPAPPPPPPVLAAEPAPPAAVPGPEAANPAASASLPSTTTSPRPQTPAPGANAPVDGARGAARAGTPPANPAAAVPPPAVETLPPATVPPPPVTGEAAAPASSDPLLTFPDVKLYSVTNGKNTSDRDALLSFAGGQLLVMPKSGGAALVTLPYGTITRATYVKARDPKWDPALPGPPEGVDVGSFIRQGRHWLVLQGPGHYEILRLEDNNVTHILSAIEARTGVKVDRPKSD
jgi:serine/threonine-protein kinase